MSNHRNGVIAISRKLFDQADPFFGGEPFTRREAWAWMIAEAAYKRRFVKASTGLGTTTIELVRGELCHSRSFMAGAWRWSEKQVRTFLAALECSERIIRSEGQAFCEKTQKRGQAKGQAMGQAKGQARNVITICKYNEYQFPISDKGQAKGQAEGTHPGPGAGQASAEKGPQLEEGLTNKRSIARSEDGFAEWYAVYPKKKNPKAAAKAYAGVIRSGSMSESLLLERTRAFAATWVKEPKARLQYCPYPSSWLNAGGYENEPEDAEPAPKPVDPSAFSDEQWRKRLSHHREADEWLPVWGPAPGCPGCLVPAHLLISPVAAAGAA